MSDEADYSGRLTWFLTGAAIGAAVALLYAPKSGKETREELANSAREGTEYLRTKTREAADNVSALVDKSKEQIGVIVDKSKEQVGQYVDRGRAQWEEFVERGKTLVADQTNRVGAAVDAGREAYKSASTEPETHEY